MRWVLPQALWWHCWWLSCSLGRQFYSSSYHTFSRLTTQGTVEPPTEQCAGSYHRPYGGTVGGSPVPCVANSIHRLIIHFIVALLGQYMAHIVARWVRGPIYYKNDKSRPPAGTLDTTLVLTLTHNFEHEFSEEEKMGGEDWYELAHFTILGCL
ncbi:hypothetical protein B0H10DRAFT_2197674, partial [Mycena sp. CBHHK59/15]